MSWHALADAIMGEHKDNVAGVLARAHRDETGVDYEVVLVLRVVQGAREAGDYEVGPVWERRVNFDGTSATAGGGSAFVMAAREQEVAAGIAWEKTR